MAAKALLVGINDYAPHGAGGPDLRGCVNDVRDAANTFLALGVVTPRPANLRILTDNRATRANILNGLQWLLTPTRGVDRLIFHYSGHGTWCVDTSGDEADRRDEAICPHDFSTAGPIIDDELRKVFSNLKPGITLEVILDSCFAGTATRDLTAAAAPAGTEVTIRFVEPPVDQAFFVHANPTAKVNSFLRGAARVVAPAPGMNHILWAACRDNQTSAEANIGGVYRGIFSYCYFKALRRAGIHVQRRRLDALVTNAIHNMGYAQVPQLECDPAELGQEIFREVLVAEAGRA
jgi:hypothetical protein